MPKMKTKSAAKKRFRVTGSGNIKFQHAGYRHNLSNKSRKRKRKLAKPAVIDKTDHERIMRCLPYGSGF
jgi:large subunit ribosomal protein L35